MPIHCQFTFPRLSDDEMKTLDYSVMKHAFATHVALGRLCDESVYQRELLRRLNAAGIDSVIEIPLKLSFQEFKLQLALDLVVQQRAIYELKTVDKLTSTHESQLLAYLFATNSTHGKLINFRTNSVESRFVNTTFDCQERSQFSFNMRGYLGDENLSSLIQELIKDWGTGLNASHYRRAILHCYNKNKQFECEQMLPMMSNGKSIGNQRFNLLTPTTALGVTAFSNPSHENRSAFQKLVSASSIKQLHWLNVTHHQLQLVTVRR